ncbi:hypothetical protein CFR76_09250 [Komagataeibacter swingsii]|uniref:Uncharacterized protein n=2 Tax=Komagataeibacter swingsii TaxID=215220 RepID=A0A2V4RI12_9PROT|nr:hypothetical protein CFR76_09250 [Komagataeibacter swingsii]
MLSCRQEAIMTVDTNSLILEQLRLIRKEIAVLRKTVESADNQMRELEYRMIQTQAAARPCY